MTNKHHQTLHPVFWEPVKTPLQHIHWLSFANNLLLKTRSSICLAYQKLQSFCTCTITKHLTQICSQIWFNTYFANYKLYIIAHKILEHSHASDVHIINSGWCIWCANFTVKKVKLLCREWQEVMRPDIMVHD